MSKIITRAKSSVDPRKYTPQVDWKKKSLNRPNLAMPRVKKVTSMEQLILEKKQIPGPSDYKNTEIKHKIYGHYGSTEPKCTITETTMFVKKSIPAPSLYESRGKSMSDIVKEKVKKCLQPVTKESPDRKDFGQRIKKNNVPGPACYNVTDALEKSAKLRSSIKNAFKKAKNVNYVSK